MVSPSTTTTSPLQTGPGTQSEVIAQLQNIARQLSAGAQSINNATPVPTTTASPKFTAVQLTTTASVIIGTSVLRHGLLLHNPGTAAAYVFQTGLTPAPTTTVLAGSILIAAGSTLSLPANSFPNINAGFSAFSSTGSNQAFTVVEFF